MALHARCVAVTAGARGDWVEKVANLLVKAGHVKVEKAREILAALVRRRHGHDRAVVADGRAPATAPRRTAEPTQP